MRERIWTEFGEHKACVRPPGVQAKLPRWCLLLSMKFRDKRFGEAIRMAAHAPTKSAIPGGCGIRCVIEEIRNTIPRERLLTTVFDVAAFPTIHLKPLIAIMGKRSRAIPPTDLELVCDIEVGSCNVEYCRRWEKRNSDQFSKMNAIEIVLCRRFS